MQRENSSPPSAEHIHEADAGELLRFDADPEMIEIFLTESIDHTEGAEAALLRLESDPDHMESIHTVFRAFHTLKSSSAFFGLTPMSELAHWAENLLSRMRTRELRCVGPYAELALRANDLLKTLLQLTGQCLKEGGIVLPPEFHTVVVLLKDPDAYAQQGTKASEATPAPTDPLSSMDSQMAADILAAREVLGLSGNPLERAPTDEEIEALIAALTGGGSGAEPAAPASSGGEHSPMPAMSTAGGHEPLPFVVESPGASELSARKEPGSLAGRETHHSTASEPAAKPSEPARTSRAPARTQGVAGGGEEGGDRSSDAGVETFLKVRMDRLDKLVNMVGELVIAQSMVAQDSVMLQDQG